MPHSWKAYELSMKIAETLLEAKLILDKDILMVRGIIQIKIEDARAPHSLAGTSKVSV